jgi:hypothetical protein
MPQQTSLDVQSIFPAQGLAQSAAQAAAVSPASLLQIPSPHLAMAVQTPS